MTRICENCGFENQDDYDYCAKCGNPLVEGLEANEVFLVSVEEYVISKKSILISYIVTILLSWSGFIIGLISKNTHVMAVTFFGFFMPFYLIQSKNPIIKKHGLIQLLISLLGVTLSFYVLLN